MLLLGFLHSAASFLHPVVVKFHRPIWNCVDINADCFCHYRERSRHLLFNFVVSRIFAAVISASDRQSCLFLISIEIGWNPNGHKMAPDLRTVNAMLPPWVVKPFQRIHFVSKASNAGKFCRVFDEKPIPGFKILKFWNFEILKFRDSEISRSWNFDILKFEIFRLWNSLMRFLNFIKYVFFCEIFNP